MGKEKTQGLNTVTSTLVWVRPPRKKRESGVRRVILERRLKPYEEQAEESEESKEGREGTTNHRNQEEEMGLVRSENVKEE